MVHPWSCANPAAGPGICKPVPKEDSLVEAYEIYIYNNICLLFPVLCTECLSLQITLSLKRKEGLCFSNAAETSYSLNQLILYLFSDHMQSPHLGIICYMLK